MRFWKFCCSLKLAIVLATLATFLLMGGSLLFPGNSQLFDQLDQMVLSDWLVSFANRKLVLSWWFYPFLLLMILLLINTACCFIDWAFHLRSRWRKGGEYLIHLGIVLLLSGYILGALGGWRHIALPCTVGTLTPLLNWPGHYLAVDKFKPVIAPSGQPTDMISEVRLLAGEKLLLAGKVQINQPLLKNGLVITPASFGRKPEGFIFRLKGQPVTLKAGSLIQRQDGSRLKVLRFLPDARLGQNGQILYRSQRLGSPALELSFTTSTGRHWQGWYFLTQPPPPILRELQLRPLQPVFINYSSLTINYDPGARLAAAGGILTAIGCLLALVSFYHKRRKQDRPVI